MHSAHGLRDRPLLKKSAMQSTKKVGRNDPCPCGSDKKFKKCYSGTEAALVH